MPISHECSEKHFWDWWVEIIFQKSSFSHYFFFFHSFYFSLFVSTKERDFDKHVAYCRDEPAAQELLQTNEQVREYFEVSNRTENVATIYFVKFSIKNQKHSVFFFCENFNFHKYELSNWGFFLTKIDVRGKKRYSKISNKSEVKNISWPTFRKWELELKSEGKPRCWPWEWPRKIAQWWQLYGREW